jgi:hypothetical protein
MHPQALQFDATIGFTIPTGNALPTVKVGEYGNDISFLHMGGLTPRLFRNLYYLDSQLMPHDAGIGKKRLIPPIGMEIRSANANPQDSHQHLVPLGNWFVDLLDHHFMRLFQHQSFHASLLA